LNHVNLTQSERSYIWLGEVSALEESLTHLCLRRAEPEAQ
jgi:hypothetical protein